MKPLWLVIAAVLLAAAWRLRMLGRTGRVLAAAAAVICALPGFGIVDLPSIDTVVGEIGSSLGAWTYLLVGACAFLETGAFLGFIVPGETMVLFGGVLAGNGTIELVPLIGIVWACCMGGDLTSYAIGRRYGREFLLKYGAKVKVGEPQVAYVEDFFVRHGTLTLFVGRAIGVVRPLVPFLAGSTRLAFPRFLGIDLVATFVWSTVMCVLGSVFWENFDELTSIVSRLLFLIGAVAVVAAVSAFVISAWRSPRRHAAIDAWLGDLARDRPKVAKPIRGAWAFVGRVEPHVPGGGRRREAAAPVGTVPESDPAPPAADATTTPSHDR
ncbi:MAG: DedA family protein [Solirubrobacteraceae bacterium]|nr:DedA family protein [Patulibacter sp.]